MHVEISVALNFLISFLYNKLPRRRVNQFGDELDAALKRKFEDHWYPEKPFKGSAFRCVKTTPPLDPVFEFAAREAGMDIADIQENLPQELSIWIDPGEVSYRMSEKGQVKILYSECAERTGMDCIAPGREVTRTFNPEAQCFKPVVEASLASQFAGMTILSPPAVESQHSPPISNSNNAIFGSATPPSLFNKPAPTSSPMTNYVAKSSNTVTMTTAAFAQTKFGSTKLKSNTKRSHRMSPTEFSNYIKQRALLQQQATLQSSNGQLISSRHSGDGSQLFGSLGSPQNSRSISPEQSPLDNYLMQSGLGGSPGSSQGSSCSESPLYGPPSHFSLPSPTARSPPFSNASNAMFDASSGYLADLLGSSEMSSAYNARPSSLQQGSHSSRFSSYNDKVAVVSPQNGSTGMGTGSGLGLHSQSALGLAGMEGQSLAQHGAAKAAFENLNLKGYTNQYQHLLVAN